MGKTSVVKIEGDSFYIITDNGRVLRINGESTKLDVLVVKEITNEILEKAFKEGFKVFQCDDNAKECLTRLIYYLYPYCKECKFE